MSESIVMPARRPIGLMIALLLVDIGLAAAGGVLLSKGLAERDDKKSEPAPGGQKSEAPRAGDTREVAASAARIPAAATAVAIPAPAPSANPAPTSPSVDGAGSAAAREAPKRATDAKLADKRPESTKVDPKRPESTKVVDAKRPESTKVVDPKRPESTKVVDAKRPESTKVVDPKRPESTKVVDPKPGDKPNEAKLVGVVPTQPQDPYAAPNTQREIDAAAAASKASFASCAADHAGHGSIKIAFQVRGDGRVINAAAVENTTGNADLARCLIAEISSWRVSAHDGTAINMLRPFTYP